MVFTSGLRSSIDFNRIDIVALGFGRLYRAYSGFIRFNWMLRVFVGFIRFKGGCKVDSG